MFRIMKSQLAEFSYFLEKYFGITSIVWSILFIAGACALIGIAISKTVEIIYKKKETQRLQFSFIISTTYRNHRICYECAGVAGVYMG